MKTDKQIHALLASSPEAFRLAQQAPTAWR
jgi:hypothetical protein